MEWIITGEAGFIGCDAASHFHRVVAVDNLGRRWAGANLTRLHD